MSNANGCPLCCKSIELCMCDICDDIKLQSPKPKTLGPYKLVKVEPKEEGPDAGLKGETAGVVYIVMLAGNDGESIIESIWYSEDKARKRKEQQWENQSPVEFWCEYEEWVVEDS